MPLGSALIPAHDSTADSSWSRVTVFSDLKRFALTLHTQADACLIPEDSCLSEGFCLRRTMTNIKVRLKMLNESVRLEASEIDG